MQKTIEDMIKKSLSNLKEIYPKNEVKTDNDYYTASESQRLVFPSYRKDPEEEKKKEELMRVSEQEARFAFTAVLEKEEIKDKSKLFYAVEVPTERKYLFSKSSKYANNNVPRIDEEHGQSASVDVCLYSKENEEVKKHYIEFKAGNVSTISKDFLKLFCDIKGKTNYFVHIVDAFVPTLDTIKSYAEKHGKAIEPVLKADQKITKNQVIVFLYCLNIEKIEDSYENKSIESIIESTIKETMNKEKGEEEKIKRQISIPNVKVERIMKDKNGWRIEINFN